MTSTEDLKDALIRMLRADNARLKELLEPILDDTADWVLPGYPQLYFQKTPRRILRLLHANIGRVVREPAIFDMLYGDRPDSSLPVSHIVAVFITKIRYALRGTPFKVLTYRGTGWSLVKEDTHGNTRRAAGAKDNHPNSGPVPERTQRQNRRAGDARRYR